MASTKRSASTRAAGRGPVSRRPVSRRQTSRGLGGTRPTGQASVSWRRRSRGPGGTRPTGHVSVTRLVATPAAVALAAAALLTGCERTEVDGIGSYTGDEEFPPQKDLASFDGCQDQDWGWVGATGTVVNRSTTTANYEIIVGYYASETRIEEKGGWVRELGPGEQREFELSVWLPDGPSITDCAVLTINRWNAGESPEEGGEEPEG